VNIVVEGYECDFVWPEERLVVETDGAAAHGTRGARKRDPARDACLMAAGWRVWRVSWAEVEAEPGVVAEQLGRLLTPAPAAPAAPRPR
jgi:very-short-patch-repair endonuclease